MSAAREAKRSEGPKGPSTRESRETDALHRARQRHCREVEAMSALTVRVGLIADTHGLLRAEALAALDGSDAIIHAGDIGNGEVLDALARIAPLTAVRGNNDDGEWARRLPLTARLEIAALRFFVIHDLATLELDPAGASIDVVVSGHSHIAKCERRGGVLYVNPGSAGPRRFRLPVSVAQLRVAGSQVESEIVELKIGSPAAHGRGRPQPGTGGA